MHGEQQLRCTKKPLIRKHTHTHTKNVTQIPSQEKEVHFFSMDDHDHDHHPSAAKVTCNHLFSIRTYTFCIHKNRFNHTNTANAYAFCTWTFPLFATTSKYDVPLLPLPLPGWNDTQASAVFDYFWYATHKCIYIKMRYIYLYRETPVFLVTMDGRWFYPHNVVRYNSEQRPGW